MYTKTVELWIPAYYIHGEFRDCATSEKLPDTYHGLCEVYDEGGVAIFHTSIESSGERAWNCIKSL